jgi:hypothetical protein
MGANVVRRLARGGLLSDGWDRRARSRAATRFELGLAGMEGRSTRGKPAAFGLRDDEGEGREAR